MSAEIRIDQLTRACGRSSPRRRADRPDGLRRAHPTRRTGPEGCPFCEGREERTPPELYAVRPGGGEAGGPGWLVRVVPNLYPALSPPGPDEAPARRATEPPEGAFAAAGDPLAASRRAGEADLFSARPAAGAHEVIIHSPRHVTALGRARRGAVRARGRGLARAHARPSRRRLRAADRQRGGRRRGLARALATRSSTRCPSCRRPSHASGSGSAPTASGPPGGDLLSDLLVEEVRRKERLVAIDDDAALICPWASRSPFELRVVPRRPAPRFEDDDCGAAMLRTALRALDGPLRRAAGAEPLGPHGPERGRGVPLARGRPAPPHRPRRLRALDRGRHQRLPARARRRGPARDARRVGWPPDRHAAQSATDSALHRRQLAGGDPARPFRRPARGRVPGRLRDDRGPAGRSRAPGAARMVPGTHLGRPRLGPGHGAGGVGRRPDRALRASSPTGSLRAASPPTSTAAPTSPTCSPRTTRAGASTSTTT